MNFHDLEILIKKILVGVAITAVPAAILLSGLWLTQHALDRGPVPPAGTQQKGTP
jgi:hypothetical protein